MFFVAFFRPSDSVDPSKMVLFHIFAIAQSHVAVSCKLYVINYIRKESTDGKAGKLRQREA